MTELQWTYDTPTVPGRYVASYGDHNSVFARLYGDGRWMWELRDGEIRKGLPDEPCLQFIGPFPEKLPRPQWDVTFLGLNGTGQHIGVVEGIDHDDALRNAKRAVWVEDEPNE